MDRDRLRWINIDQENGLIKFKILQNYLKLLKKLHPRAPVVRLVIFNLIRICVLAKNQPHLASFGPFGPFVQVLPREALFGLVLPRLTPFCPV